MNGPKMLHLLSDRQHCPRLCVGRRSAAFGLACALALLSAQRAQAQEAPIDANHFHPAVGNERILTTDLAAVGPNWQLVPQLFLHYADAPMVLTLGSEYQSDIVRNRVSGELGLSLALRDRIQIGLSFPVTLTQDGDPVMIMPVFDGDQPVNPPEEVASSGLEDLRLSVKGVLWRKEGLGFGAGGYITAPTAGGESYLGSGSPTLDLKLLGHYSSGRLTAGANLGWLFASTEQVLATKTGMALTFSAGAQYQVYQQEQTNVALAAELFGLAHSRFASARETPIELLLAAKAAYREWTFFLGGGPGLTAGYGEPNVRVLGGLSYSWKPSPKPPRIVKPEPPRKPVEPKKEPEPEPEEPETDRWVDSTLTLPSDVLFDYDRCAIKEQSYGELRKVADSLKDHPEWGNIRIEGHASQEAGDSVGDSGIDKDQYNLRLSRCRASRVADFLIHFGVEAARISYLGFGYRCPEAPNDTEDNRRKNRRVEFVRNPELNPPKCEVPPQIEPLFKHSSEPKPYKLINPNMPHVPAGQAPAPGAAPAGQGATPAGQAPAPGAAPAGQAPAPSPRPAPGAAPAAPAGQQPQGARPAAQPRVPAGGQPTGNAAGQRGPGQPSKSN